MMDRRYYFRVDVGYLDNPKIEPLVEADPRAVLLHLWAIGYSKQHGTDGVVPIKVGMRHVCIEQCSEQCGEQCYKQCSLNLLVQSGLIELIDSTHALVHDYLEHQDSSETVKRASDKAKRAAEARWSDATSNATSNAPGNASSNANRNAKERRGEETSSAIEDDFKSWWMQYPRKDAKVPAKKAYKAARKTTDAQVILDGITRQLPSLTAGERRFIPLPASWLNGQRWLDETPAAQYEPNSWMRSERKIPASWLEGDPLL